jgi:hypothetical protein
MRKRLEAALKRPLEPDEKRHVEWLMGWDYDKRIAAEGLLIAMYRGGQMDVMQAVEELFTEKR